MSASRPFIDVLVGKLTAYDDASSRPTSATATSIVTPAWLASLAALPVAAAVAARAYVVEAAATSSSADVSAPASRPRHGPSTRKTSASPRSTSAPRRTASQLAAIQLLRRLGADEVDGTSSDAQLRSACRRLLRECHPDAHPHLDAADAAALNVRLRAVLQARAALALPSSSCRDSRQDDGASGGSFADRVAA